MNDNESICFIYKKENVSIKNNMLLNSENMIHVEYSYCLGIINLFSKDFTEILLPSIPFEDMLTIRISSVQNQNKLYLKNIDQDGECIFFEVNLVTKTVKQISELQRSITYIDELHYLKISENLNIGLFVDNDCMRFAKENFFEENISKCVVFNPNKNEKNYSPLEENIDFVFFDSEHNEIMISEDYHPSYNFVLNKLVIYTPYALGKNRFERVFVFELIK